MNPIEDIIKSEAGIKLGQMRIEKCATPRPHLRLLHIIVPKDQRDQGHANALMDTFEKRLREEGIPGVAHDLSLDIGKGNFYERRGWTRIGNTKRLTFNLHEGADGSDLWPED